MKPHLLTTLAALFAASIGVGTIAEPSQASQVTTRLLLGSKQLSSDWEEHDKQAVIGVIADYQAGPVALAFDIFGGGNESRRGGTRSEAYTAEAHLGMRLRCFDQNTRWQPYLGAGLALVYAESKPQKDDDRAVGYWLGVGADVAINPSLTLGADLRYSHAELDLNNTDLDAGGTQFGLTLGYRW